MAESLSTDPLETTGSIEFGENFEEALNKIYNQTQAKIDKLDLLVAFTPYQKEQKSSYNIIKKNEKYWEEKRTKLREMMFPPSQ